MPACQWFDSAPGHHLKLKKPLRSRWGFCFCGFIFLYRAHGLHIGHVLLNERNLERPVTGRSSIRDSGAGGSFCFWCVGTYATLEMLCGEVDIHILGKQMGNSAAMIERHYSKLTATMAAERLA
jgi:hypothetical protein